jgi:hypothetical protein
MRVEGRKRVSWTENRRQQVRPQVFIAPQRSAGARCPVRWPNVNSGHIPGTIDDTWARIDGSLRHGYRGLPRGTRLTLARLLAKRRGVRNSEYPPRLTAAQILHWARQLPDSHLPSGCGRSLHCLIAAPRAVPDV